MPPSMTPRARDVAGFIASEEHHSVRNLPSRARTPEGHGQGCHGVNIHRVRSLCQGNGVDLAPDRRLER